MTKSKAPIGWIKLTWLNLKLLLVEKKITWLNLMLSLVTGDTSDAKGFVISFDNDSPVKPKPVLRPKRTSRWDL